MQALICTLALCAFILGYGIGHIPGDRPGHRPKATTFWSTIAVFLLLLLICLGSSLGGR